MRCAHLIARIARHSAHCGDTAETTLSTLVRYMKARSNYCCYPEKFAVSCGVFFDNIKFFTVRETICLAAFINYFEISEEISPSPVNTCSNPAGQGKHSDGVSTF